MARVGRMQFWKSVESGKWHFHHKSANGKVDEPSQPYTLRATCRRAALKAARRRGEELVQISDPNAPKT